MSFLLDANVIIGLFAGKPTLVDRVARQVPGDLAVSVIVLHELYFGLLQRRPDN